MSDDFATLQGMLDALWTRLDGAVRDKGGAARYLTLATRGLMDGAEARMVVLRQADRAGGTLTLHTHALSHKIAELAADPMATLLMWDPEVSFQARLKVKADASPGSDADWARVPEIGRRLNYGSLPPAMPIAAPDATNEASPDRAAFTRILAQIEQVDALQIAPESVRRARYSRDLDFEGRWIAP